MLIESITKFIRRYFTGNKRNFVFRKQNTPEFINIDAIHLYIHIPFCKYCCPYCPYNKIQIDENKVESYFRALHKEIDLYHDSFGSIRISSIYFGGGSPGLFPEKIASVIEHISKCFTIEGELCIELNPNDCSVENLKLLHSSGIQTISIGVQSFHDPHLAAIGRSYNGLHAEKALENASGLFNSLNVDLMFALSSQNNTNISHDLLTTIKHGAHQITTYPLFTFPYSTVGKYKKKKKVTMPALITRKRQFYQIYDTLTNQGYHQVSVWSFKKGNGSKYSSVTRDGYLGFGAGAGSHLSDGFYLNTFSVDSYIKRLENGEFPTALKFAMDKQMNDLFWLYWRFYDTRIPLSEFNGRFCNNRKVKWLFSILQAIGMISINDNEYVLTRKGSFWLHLAQNYFSLRYINQIWTQAMKDDFPDEIRF